MAWSIWSFHKCLIGCNKLIQSFNSFHIHVTDGRTYRRGWKQRTSHRNKRFKKCNNAHLSLRTKQGLFQSDLEVDISILGACNLGAHIKYCFGKKNEIGTIFWNLKRIVKKKCIQLYFIFQNLRHIYLSNSACLYSTQLHSYDVFILKRAATHAVKFGH